MCSRKAQCQGRPDNPETGDTYEYHSRERRSCAGQKIVQSTKTYTGGAAAAAVRVYTYVRIQARPISTNPRSMEEESEYGLPNGTCFTARRLEVVAVAGLLWIYFVVCPFSAWWNSVFFFRFLYFQYTRPTASTRQPCLMYLSTSDEARQRERIDRDRFLPIGKEASSYRGAYRVPLFN